MNRVFVISPANCNGERARWVLRRNARSDLAQRLRAPGGAPLGEVFTFLSALYFRGKLAYAQTFARPPANGKGVLIITPTAGLLPHDVAIRLSRLRGFSRVPITVKNRLYRYSLLRAVKKLALEIGPDCEVVLLGSIATGKYLDILTEGFGERLLVPADFIGLGDMSRGALLLRCVRENRELDYMPAARLAAAVLKRPKRSRRTATGSSGRESSLKAASVAANRVLSGEDGC
jgi:hypothetical protein